MTFTVPADVDKVVILVAGYKANAAKISVNGGEVQTISTKSDDGDYTAVEVDTTVNKTVTFATVSGGYRCMINAIQFVDVPGASGEQPEETEAPEVTTEAPEATTEAPEATTEAPEATTEAPEATTEAVVDPEEPVEPEEPAAPTPITASKTVADLIKEYGWTGSTTKQSFNLDEKVSVKINGGSNTGKAYDGNNIRIYATDSPAGTITISVPDGYQLVSIKISTQTGTYAFLYVDGTTTDICNVETAVSGSSVVLNSVKNGSNGKQVRVTGFEVVYQAVGQ
jgi:hypothetical protein